MVKCLKCKTENEDDAGFCTNCGNKLEKPKAKKLKKLLKKEEVDENKAITGNAIILIIVVAAVLITAFLLLNGGGISTPLTPQPKITVYVTGSIGFSGLFYGFTGKATFSNSGDASGSKCINVVIGNSNTGAVETSSQVCSGTLAPGNSIDRDISIGLGALGGPYTYSYY